MSIIVASPDVRSAMFKRVLLNELRGSAGTLPEGAALRRVFAQSNGHNPL
jgi:hypothetical protein